LWTAGSDLEAPGPVGESELSSVLTDREAASNGARQEKSGLIGVVLDDDHRPGFEDSAPPELSEHDRVTWAETLHRSDDIWP
jgi:hypothetical protein